MTGIVSYGAYLPYWRLDRRAVRAALGQGGGKGTRTVASYDEDTTSMAVEAGRAALAAAPAGFAPSIVTFSTACPAYLDKTNATAVHAALGLDEAAAAFDIVGAARSATGAMRLAASSPAPSLVTLADIRVGLPGGGEESSGGDAAVAFAYGEGPVLAEELESASSTGEFLDRWRTPGDPASRLWEERFGEAAYGPLARAAVTEALKGAGVAADAVDHVVVTGLHARAARAVLGWIGASPAAAVDDLSATVGNTGTAHAGLLLASVLDTAEPGSTVLVVHLADGADVTLYRTTDVLAAWRSRRPVAATVAAQVAAGRNDLPYASLLTWRGLLEREPPRRPDPDAPAAPPSLRRQGWKFGFAASRCTGCGTRHLPPARVCLHCRAVDDMVPERLADVEGTIATYTVDRLAFSLAPPVVAAVIDFDGGGRFPCEMTDVDPDEVEIGARVAMTFRRLHTAGNGVHDYFWKARLSKHPSEGA